MILNEQTLANMVGSVNTELATLFANFKIPEDVITDVTLSVKELLRNNSTLSNYSLKIDRWPVGELQRIFDRAHFGGADFTAKTWIEIVVNYADEKVTIKRSPTENTPTVLYERSRKVEVEPAA